MHDRYAVEGYPPDWVRLVLAVSPSGIYHSIGGDRNPADPDAEANFIGMARIERRIAVARELQGQRAQKLEAALRGLLEIEEERIASGMFKPNAEAMKRIEAARAALEV